MSAYFRITVAVTVLLGLLALTTARKAAPPKYIDGLPSFTDRPTYPHIIRFEQVEQTKVKTSNAEAGSFETTYRSPAMPLQNGEVVFTDPTKTFLTFPKGPIAITGFYAEVVDEHNVSVPLSEAYLHHWLVFGPPNKGVCGGWLDYNFGVGAESRGTAVKFPSPYALTVDGTEKWGANIHILRTVDLDPKYGVKNCIECMYAPGKGCSPEENGQFACCLDGSFCPTNSRGEAKNYYLQYKVWWKPIDASVKPVDIFVLDASNCQIEYNIYPTANNLSVTTLGYQVPADSAVVFSVGHQHIGAYNITLYHGKTQDDMKPLCTSIPKYGTQVGVAGNEKGYVVAIPACVFDEPYKVAKGEYLKLESLYNVGSSDPRTFDTGMHGGVMSLFYIATASN